MKRAPRSRQRHDLYAKYHDYDSEISDLLGECGFKWLWERQGVDVGQMVKTTAGNYPDTFDEIMAVGNAIAGSPETVRQFIEEEVAATGINYFVSWLAFGDLTPEETIRSAELLAEVGRTVRVSGRPDVLAAAK